MKYRHFYSVLTILMGVLSFLTVKDDKIEESERISFQGIGEVLKLPAVWIISFVTFCNYVFTLSLYYFTPVADRYSGSFCHVHRDTGCDQRWFSLFGNVGGGYITDKVGTGKMLLLSFLAMAAGTLGILLLPTNSGSIMAFTVLFIVIYIFYNVNYAMTWAMMDEGAIPAKYPVQRPVSSSTVGYLPEIFCSLLAGALIDGNRA